VRDLLDRNRTVAVDLLHDSVLRYQPPFAKVSVAWFRIDHPTLTASELQREGAQSDIYLLPGRFFYWSQPSKGEQFVRIALARDPEMFETAIVKLRNILDRYDG
jgi:aspartate/methionine/tyrosine aminotransferase